jgi:hypothetical protein
MNGGIKMEVNCARCGKKLEETKYLIQASIYVGDTSKRLPLCNECYSEFATWFGHSELLPYDPPCKINDKYWAIAYGDQGIPLQVVQVKVIQIDIKPEEVIIWIQRIDDRPQDYWQTSVEDFLKWSHFKSEEEAIETMNKIKE